ncbi:MAG: YlmC/YmxH family sporulation protein [Clostridia bacterium]|nr:YlmC/YmxH family sporulation protein [Clostridia bacterium]
MTFTDLKRKEVINVSDGKRLGCVCDVIIEINTCRIDAIIVPGSFNLLCLQKPKSIIIPWNKIRKLGDDVILVDAGEVCPR